MRLLLRNLQDVYYANPTGWTYAQDANGFKTGDKEVSYSEPVKVRMSVAPSLGTNSFGTQSLATIEPYGMVTGYTHRAFTTDMKCSMSEESRVWYGITPTITVIEDGVEREEHVPHNYEVVYKTAGLNHLIYYLKEVDVK